MSLGHSYPLQLKFKGGKGLSIYFVFFLAPYLFLIGFVVITIGKWIGKKDLLLFLSLCIINILYFLENTTVERLILLLPTSVVLWRHQTNLIKNK